MCEGSAWHIDPHLQALVQSNAKVLDEVLYHEARVEVTLQNSWPIRRETEAAGSAALKQLDHLVKVNAGLITIDKRLTDTEDGACNHHVVCHFSLMALAWPAHVHHLRRVNFHQTLTLLESLDLTTDHDDELATLGSNITTGDRSVKRCNAAALELGGNSLCQVGRAAGVVDEIGAIFHSINNPVLWVKDN